MTALERKRGRDLRGQQVFLRPERDRSSNPDRPTTVMMRAVCRAEGSTRQRLGEEVVFLKVSGLIGFMCQQLLFKDI
ncbi:hypothetical protein J4Q44_G00326050 [Coregonus suidteri]|uniref:Uncharacterized protein n=1 Tax=Coregonus suidteri TaxID=861788 RepID=A0AAN8QH64_9TELE